MIEKTAQVGSEATDGLLLQSYLHPKYRAAFLLQVAARDMPAGERLARRVKDSETWMGFDLSLEDAQTMLREHHERVKEQS